jgi:mRNA interferase MazF
VILQGELYWFAFRGRGSEPDGRRPCAVVQHDRFNRSRMATTLVVPVTSNLTLAAMPGNVRLRKGEGNLPRPSVVNVSQIVTLDKARLDQRLGVLAPGRIHQVLAGLALVLGFDELDARWQRS